MNEHVNRRSTVLFFGSLAFLTTAVAVGMGEPPKAKAKKQGEEIGGLIPGASAAEKAAFESGKEVFEESEGPEKGIGPVFNGTSCGECHVKGALGGAGFDLLAGGGDVKPGDGASRIGRFFLNSGPGHRGGWAG